MDGDTIYSWHNSKTVLSIKKLISLPQSLVGVYLAEEDTKKCDWGSGHRYLQNGDDAGRSQ